MKTDSHRDVGETVQRGGAVAPLLAVGLVLFVCEYTVMQLLPLLGLPAGAWTDLADAVLLSTLALIALYLIGMRRRATFRRTDLLALSRAERRALPVFMGYVGIITVSIWLHRCTVEVQGEGTRVLELAGRQRMLSQRMASDALDWRLGKELGAETAADRLRSIDIDAEAFELTLRALIDGDASLGLRVVEDETVRANLARVRVVWEEMRRLLPPQGDLATLADVRKLGDASAALLAATDRTTQRLSDLHDASRHGFNQLETLTSVAGGFLCLFALVLLLRQAGVRRYLHAGLIENEQRLRAIVDAAADGIISIDEQGRAVTYNAAAARLFGYEEREVIGRNINMLMPEPYATEHDSYMTRYLRTGQKKIIGIEREAVARRKDGSVVPIELSVSEVRLDGRRVFTGLIRDITARKASEAALRTSERRLREQNVVLVELAHSPVVTSGDVESAVRLVVEAAARTLDVERVGVWLYDGDRAKLSCRGLFERSLGRHSSGPEIAAIDYPAYTRAMEEQRTIAVDEARLDPRTTEFLESYLIPNGITSMLDAPIRVGGKLVGVICHEHVGSSRSWAMDEQQFAGSMADLLSLALETRARNEAEAAGRESEQRFRSLVEQAADGLYVHDVEGRIVDVNQRACQSLGYNREELLAMHVWDVESAVSRETLLDAWGHLVPGVPRTLDGVHRRKDGTQYPVEVRLGSVESSGHRFVLALARDVSDRKEAERALKEHHKLVEAANCELKEKQAALQQQADELMRLYDAATRYSAELAEATAAAEAANRAKSDFLANMSHEIRTPMTAILGYTDVLAESPISEDQKKHAIETLRRNGRHLLTLVNDILDISKMEAGKLDLDLGSCHVGDVVSDAVELLRPAADRKGLAIKARVIDRIPAAIVTDTMRLRQALVNLIGNAVKFSGQGDVEIALECDAEAETLTFHVIDHGLGISPEQLRTLFQPFTQADMSMTRRFGGTGLGLAITRRIAQLLGGDVVVSSEQGSGSTFSLTVATGSLSDATWGRSLNVRPTDREVDVPNARAVARLDDRVLLVEDGEDNQRLITHFLEHAGAHVSVAENGQVGLDTALAAWYEARPFSVILMDMQMPVMDGYTATRRLREAGYDGQIIALTAHAMSGEEQRCLAAGCDHYMTKPVDRHALLCAVASRGGVRSDNALRVVET